MKRLLVVMRDWDSEIKISYSGIGSYRAGTWIPEDYYASGIYIYRDRYVDDRREVSTVHDLLKSIDCLPENTKRIFLTEEQSTIVMGYFLL